MAVSSKFGCRLVPESDPPVVILNGELDIAATDQAEEVLEPILAQSPAGLVFDLRAVTFVDSRGLSVLIRTKMTLGNEATVSLRCPTPRIRDLLRAAGVDHIFDIELAAC